MKRKQRERQASGLVYRNAADLMHIGKDQHSRVGREMADFLDAKVRAEAVRDGRRTHSQAYGEDALPVCPGCYMEAAFSMLLELARRSGQTATELGNSMGDAFRALAAGDVELGAGNVDVPVVLDTEPHA